MDLHYRWLGIYVKNWDLMTGFFRDVLDLKLVNQDSDSTLFSTGNGFQIEIFDAKQHPAADRLAQGQNNIMIGCSVDNVERTVEKLKARGVKFDMEVQVRNWGKFIYFLDPEANQWQLFEYNKPTA